MTRILYSFLRTSARIFSSKISVSRNNPSLTASRRWARILIWLVLSSPLTYSVFLPWAAKFDAIFSSKVLLPMPGLPPISTSEPSTTPPPRTRSSSLFCVLIRVTFSISTSLICFARLGFAELFDISFSVSICCALSSKKLSQAPH